MEAKYGRKEMAPEMGGTLWAYEGMSPGITSGAEGVLQGQRYYDSYGYFDSQDEDTARTILTTLEKETSDIRLYSGHHRDRGSVSHIIKEGVSFPLVATSPERALADDYAGEGSVETPAVVFEFPPGSQAGFYRNNEFIATGEYETTSYRWNPDKTKVTIQLNQTKRNTVPEITEEEEA